MFTSAIVNQHLQSIPHANALGLRCYGVEEDFIEILLPYADHLIGDPDSGVVHGGAITALLDNASGFIARPGAIEPGGAAIATLDLRIDYLRPATAGRDIIARAEMVKNTRTISFIRARAYDSVIEDPVAISTAAFMMGTPNRKVG